MILSGVCALAALGLGTDVRAQAFPSKPIRIVVPAVPGGGTDILARLLSPRLQALFGQSIVVENRAGASTNIGTEFTARAAPDGYTVLIATTPHAVNPTLFAKLPFDPIRDFTMISLLARTTTVLVVHPSLPVRNVKELVALAKKRPGELNYGSSGTGGSNHLATELFAKAAGVRIVHVPYKSIGPAITDLVGGNVQLVITSLPSALVQVKAGRIKALGVAAEKRSVFAPEIPTVIESGVNYVTELWWGLAAPGRTSPEIVNRLSDVLRKAMQTPQLKQQYATEGGEPMPMTPQEFQKYVFTEVNRWRQVVKDAGLQLE